MLIALQAHQRGIVPEHVAGFHAWIKLGRAVRKGEQAIRILAPVTVKPRDGEDGEERRVFFKTTFVFGRLSRVCWVQRPDGGVVVSSCQRRSKSGPPCRSRIDRV